MFFVPIASLGSDSIAKVRKRCVKGQPSPIAYKGRRNSNLIKQLVLDISIVIDQQVVSDASMVSDQQVVSDASIVSLLVA